MKLRITFFAALLAGSLLAVGGCWPSLPSGPDEGDLDEEPDDGDVDDPFDFTGQVSFTLVPPGAGAVGLHFR